jgi:hypothetical protein
MGMDPTNQPIKGVSRYSLRARLKTKRAQNQWHFGPKSDGKELQVESVDRMLLRIRNRSTLDEQ